MLVARGRESIFEAFVQVPSRQLTLSELTQQLADEQKRSVSHRPFAGSAWLCHEGWKQI